MDYPHRGMTAPAIEVSRHRVGTIGHLVELVSDAGAGRLSLLGGAGQDG
jgi:hypothetical protein